MTQSAILDELFRHALNRRYLGQQLAETDDRLTVDELSEIIRHGPILEVLVKEPLDRHEIEERLGVSRATSHRLTRWLDERGLVEKEDGKFILTGKGEVIAEEILRFEANVRTVQRLAPLLDAICENHREFVIEPFANATVTTPDPANPYRPVDRFVELASESATLRGFNTTAMAPLSNEAFYEHLLEETETELIYPKEAIEGLFVAFPDQATAAIDSDRLLLQVRDRLPYGLAIFDDRVGIGGYDEETGILRVFVDTNAVIAREWAEEVYETYKTESDPQEKPEAPSKPKEFDVQVTLKHKQ